MPKRYTKMSLAGLAASFLLAGVALSAQAQEAPPPKEPKADSRYASEQAAGSGFAVELHSEATWDDNIFANNARRKSDDVFQEGGLFSIWSRRPSWGVGLEYRPNALLYRTVKGFNQFDHHLDFDNEFHASRHLLFRLKDSLDYMTGVLEPRANQDLSLPIGGSSNLNATLFTPFARQLANEAAGEVEYEMSRRSFFSVSGSHGFRRFTNAGGGLASVVPNLFNTQSDTGGTSYQYRMTRHFTTGVQYLFQNLRFSQASHGRAHNAFLTVLWEAGPHVTLSIFAGPQYSDTTGQFLIASTNPLQPGNVVITLRTMQWHPAGGASLTLRSNQTVFRLTARRQVLDGGGLLTTVTNTYGGAEIRRRLAWKWDLAITTSVARSVSLQGPLGKGAVDTQAVGVAIEHPLFENLNLHTAYNYLRQRVNQTVPLGADLDRNQFTVGLFYRAHEHKF